MRSTGNMSHVACPHCSFQNFAISAYCGRCERPLRGAVGAVPGGHEVLAGVVSNLTPSVAKKPPLMRPPLAAVPPPEAPALELAPQVALPITVPDDAVRQIEQKKKKQRDSARRAFDYQVALPTLRRVAISHLIDLILILLCGLSIAALEALLFAEPSDSLTIGALDWMAGWIHRHPDPSLHGAIFALVAGLAYATCSGRGNGMTLGRALTGTVLVRRSGGELSWAIASVRAVVSLVSFFSFGAGFFWTMLDGYRRTWQDLLTGTVVVQRKLRAVMKPSSS